MFINGVFPIASRIVFIMVRLPSWPSNGNTLNEETQLLLWLVQIPEMGVLEI